MQIVRLVAGDEDRLEGFLAQYPESSMFLRSNLRRSGLTFVPEAFHGAYWAASAADGSILGVLAQYWNGNVLMQAPDVIVLDAIIDQFLQQNDLPIAGVLGPGEQASRVIARLAITADACAFFATDDLYSLSLEDLVEPATAVPGLDRIESVATISPAVFGKWLRAYEIEALGREDNAHLTREVERQVAHMQDAQDLWVLMIGDKPVAMSGFNARLPDCVQIGRVWTPPENRNRGYARRVVAATLKEAREEGVQRAILFTDSLAADRAYRALGFAKCGTYQIALLKSPRLPT